MLASEVQTEPLAVDLACGLDPVVFATKRLGIIPDAWQAQALRSPRKRLLLNCSRQAGKSTFAALLALHRAIYHPKSLVLLISPSQRQSSELFRKIGTFMALLNPRPALSEDQKTGCQFHNGSRIVSLPASEATVRGFSSPDLIIEDEASRVDDDFYRSVRPMLAVSNGRMILMSTPFGKRGHFFEEWHSDSDGWERIRIPATECPRISPKFIEEEKRSLGHWWFRQEYMCEFGEAEDQVFGYDEVMAAITDAVQPLFETPTHGVLP